MWSQYGATPYSEFNGWLNSSFLSGNGKVATSDYERLNSPTVNAELNKVSMDVTLASQTADLAPIETYVSQNLPIIPVFTRAAYFDYNSTRFVGWPSPSDPYTAMEAGGSQDMELLAMHLKPVA